MSENSAAPLPLRERKKAMTREAIRQAAERLFEERGFDSVTVADIADAANISVKTLFTYIRSKEELVFQDDSLIKVAVAALRDRPRSVTPTQAISEALIDLAEAKGSPTDSLGRFHRGYGESDPLQSRLARLWMEYETILAGELAVERGLDAPNAALRFEAAQLVLLMRSTTWREVYADVSAAGPRGQAVLEGWLRGRAAKIEAAVTARD